MCETEKVYKLSSDSVPYTLCFISMVFYANATCYLRPLPTNRNTI